MTEQGEGIDLTIPENITGTLSDFQSINEKTIMFSSSSFTQPDRYFNFNTETAEVIQVWEEEIPGFDPSEYQEVSAYYPSKDGTMIPITYSLKNQLN